MATEKKSTLTIVLASVYGLVLVWFIVFKFQTSLAALHVERVINWVPFAGFEKDWAYKLNEIRWNTLPFIPFGVYLSMLAPQWSFGKKLAVIAGTSLAFEAIQYAFAIGRADITDVITNSLGGLLGILIFWLAQKLLKRHTTKVIHVFAVCATAAVLVFVFLLVNQIGFIFRI